MRLDLRGRHTLKYTARNRVILPDLKYLPGSFVYTSRWKRRGDSDVWRRLRLRVTCTCASLEAGRIHSAKIGGKYWIRASKGCDAFGFRLVPNKIRDRANSFCKSTPNYLSRKMRPCAGASLTMSPGQVFSSQNLVVFGSCCRGCIAFIYPRQL